MHGHSFHILGEAMSIKHSRKYRGASCCSSPLMCVLSSIVRVLTAPPMCSLSPFYQSIVWGDRVVYSQGFGSRDGAGGPPPTSRSVFNTGSVSKMVTGALLQAAYDQGVLSLDDEVEPFPWSCFLS